MTLATVDKPALKPCTMINLFIADDHQLVIDGIKLMLSEEEDIVCKGEANDGAMALERLKQANYDII